MQLQTFFLETIKHTKFVLLISGRSKSLFVIYIIKLFTILKRLEILSFFS